MNHPNIAKVLVVDVQLNLREGQLFFNVTNLSQTARFEIKVPDGIAGIRTPAKGNIRSDSSLELFDGTLVFVSAPTGGTPTPPVLKAPPSVKFELPDELRHAPNNR